MPLSLIHISLICGLFLIVFSVWLYHHTMETRLYTLPLNIIFYMAATLVLSLIHILHRNEREKRFAR